MGDIPRASNESSIIQLQLQGLYSITNKLA